MSMLAPAFIGKVREVVGADNVLVDKESLVCYSFDATKYTSLPDAVVKPRTTDETSRIVTLCRDESMAVTPRGAGTGLSGGSVPAKGGLVLSTERMVSPALIQKEDLYAIVEPGVTTESLQKQVESRGLFYPPDPASRAACTIGGNVAECAGGLRGLKYGTTKDYVLGLELVTPEGKVIRSGARTVKSVAGYDVTRLMVGSEGTLGIITSVIVRLLPLPAARRVFWCKFDGVTAATEAVNDLIGAGLLPSGLEIMDEKTVKAVETYHGDGLGAGVLLLGEFDGAKAVCDADASKAIEILKSGRGKDIETDLGGRDPEDLWKARRSVLPALTRLSSTVILEDVTVPRSKLPEMVERIRKISGRYGLQIAVFGHAGDGNLHPSILTDRKKRDEMKRVKVAVSEMMRACIDLGGTISGEHGIGVDKMPYVRMELGEAGCEIMRRVKNSLDPKGIMNPGKIFDEA
jgi:glycolate oxidase